MLVNMADELQNTLPNSFTDLQFLPHGLALSASVCCFGVELPGLQHSVASLASAETLIASSELNFFSFAKNSGNKF